MNPSLDEDVVDLCAALPLALQPHGAVHQSSQLLVLDLAIDVVRVQVVERPRLRHRPHSGHRVDHLGGYSVVL